MKNLELLVTLWPSFSHFKDVKEDKRVSGIRLNGPITFSVDRIKEDIKYATALEGAELHFDVKGGQLRVKDVYSLEDHLEIRITHRITVNELPAIVLFKDGRDSAKLIKVDGDRLVFDGGPKYQVQKCEPIYLRHLNPEKTLEFSIDGKIISDYEIERINTAKELGINRFMLSYVESPRDIDILRGHIGKDAEVTAKIESKKGLEYVAKRFKQSENVSLMLARGDLYVELDMPHDILKATKLIIENDPEAMVGSRIFHSLANNPVPECADFSDLALLYNLGYRRFLLCDEICLNKELLTRAINAFEAFRKDYAENQTIYNKL